MSANGMNRFVPKPEGFNGLGQFRSPGRFREIFGVARFSTFATESAPNRLGRSARWCLLSGNSVSKWK
jgi:hypothetical protein